MCAEKSIYNVTTIAVIERNNARLAISETPGRKRLSGRTLREDLEKLRLEKIQTIFCLLDQEELDLLNLTTYPQIAQEYGFIFCHHPLCPDVKLDTKCILRIVKAIVAQLEGGRNVLVHCKKGLGRSAIICACCLLHYQMSPKKAINAVQEHRLGALSHKKQEKIIADYCRALVDYCR